MGVDLMTQLGTDNKNKRRHKAGSTTWTYAEGKLSHSSDGIDFTLSSCDTLAVCNLLAAHYEEIVKEARREQRHTEELNPKSPGRYKTYVRPKPV